MLAPKFCNFYFVPLCFLCSFLTCFIMRVFSTVTQLGVLFVFCFQAGSYYVALVALELYVG